MEKVPPLNTFLQDLKSQRLYQQQQQQQQQQQEGKPAKTAATAADEHEYKVICYVASWAWYRKSHTKFTPDYIDAGLCTHLVYAFASLDAENYTITVADPVTDIDNGELFQLLSPYLSLSIYLSIHPSSSLPSTYVLLFLFFIFIFW